MFPSGLFSVYLDKSNHCVNYIYVLFKRLLIRDIPTYYRCALLNDDKAKLILPKSMNTEQIYLVEAKNHCV